MDVITDGHLDLYAINEVLAPVAKRVRKHRDSLTVVGRFSLNGIEGWLKVETLAALRDIVQEVKNNGPDLILKYGHEGVKVELKGATDFNPKWVAEGSLKYGSFCLFLGNGSNLVKIESLQNRGVELLGKETFSDGEREWVVGLIRPCAH